MLFDLRSSGRRRTVKIIYLFLAVVMAGGLILFGVGSNTNGGFLDAINPFGGGSPSQSSTYDKQAQDIEKQIKKQPNNANLWDQLATKRLQQAALNATTNNSTGQLTYTAKSTPNLKQAITAWDKYLSLKPAKPDSALAASMVQVYISPVILDIGAAAKAQDIYATNTPPAATSYYYLAQLYYAGGDISSGEKAAAKTLSLAPQAQKAQYKKALDQIKAQALLEQAKKKKNFPSPSKSKK